MLWIIVWYSTNWILECWRSGSEWLYEENTEVFLFCGHWQSSEQCFSSSITLRYMNLNNTPPLALALWWNTSHCHKERKQGRIRVAIYTSMRRWVCTICFQCVSQRCAALQQPGTLVEKNINASWIKTAVKVKPLNKEALVKRSERQCEVSHQWSNRGFVDIIEAFISHTDLTRKLLIFQLFAWIAFSWSQMTHWLFCSQSVHCHLRSHIQTPTSKHRAGGREH